ncbi:MAG: DUF1304 domain-containing protein [Spirochaetia bacterium]|nr:DUF1304 domain-containing protein [Spirochaetia bacterium]
MKTTATILTGLVALLHFGFMYLEMFLWQSEFGLKTFGMTPEVAANSAVLAMNQGLYNGLLAGGLVWSFITKNENSRLVIRTVILTMIVIAGGYGAATAKFSILFTQALPAALALLLTRLSKPA